MPSGAVFDMTIWLGIAVCISQSAMFSGMNLAVFSISRLRLEAEAAGGNADALRLLEMRQDANFLLTTILWGNVGINVLLTLLSDSVMAGLLAFLFSTFLITFAGEILPQAYFSRHALRMAALLGPVLRVYQIILYPFAKPCALLLDRWLGPEGLQYFRERDLREVIKIHMTGDGSDVGQVEGVGAINFLAFDDVQAGQEGEPLAPESVLSIPLDEGGLPVFPKISNGCSDPFLKNINRSGKKWAVLVDAQGAPQFVLDVDGFIRTALLQCDSPSGYVHCHRPIVVTDAGMKLGALVEQFKVFKEAPDDDVIDHDIILVWSHEKRIITGADLLGRLMRGITKVKVAE